MKLCSYKHTEIAWDGHEPCPCCTLRRLRDHVSDLLLLVEAMAEDAAELADKPIEEQREKIVQMAERALLHTEGV